MRIKRVFSIVASVAVIMAMSYIAVRFTAQDYMEDEPFAVEDNGDTIRMSVSASVPDGYYALDSDGNISTDAFSYLQDKSSGDIYKFHVANTYNIWFTLLKNDDGSHMTKSQAFVKE